jgi:hypothetical protein
MAGRPTKYKKEYNEQVYKLALLGATDKEFADFFNVGEKTINNWKEKEPEFLQSIKEGKIEADAKVSESLYKRALGYTYEEERIEKKNGKEVSKTITKKEVVPDVAAINIWLKNRRGRINPEEGQKWADKQEVEHSGNIDNTTTITALNKKEQDKIERLLKKFRDESH